MTETIQTLKEDIAILQEKLRKLEEQDPEMLLLRQGKVDAVDYDGKKYFRIEYTDSFAGEYNWYVRKVGEDAIRPVRDVNVYAPLEELYQKEVVKQKEEYPYLKPHTPEKTEQLLREAFQKVQQTEEWKETQRKIDEPTKPVNEVLDRLENKYENDEVVNRMLKKWEENPPEFLKFEMSRSLETRIYKWWETCFVYHTEWSMEECVEDLLDIITSFLPAEQSAEGSQNVYTEVAVDAHNELLQKIKSKLRNKK